MPGNLPVEPDIVVPVDEDFDVMSDKFPAAVIHRRHLGGIPEQRFALSWPICNRTERNQLRDHFLSCLGKALSFEAFASSGVFVNYDADSIKLTQVSGNTYSIQAVIRTRP